MKMAENKYENLNNFRNTDGIKCGTILNETYLS